MTRSYEPCLCGATDCPRCYPGNQCPVCKRAYEEHTEEEKVECDRISEEIVESFFNPDGDCEDDPRFKR